MINVIRFFIAATFFAIVLFVNDASADRPRQEQNFITTKTEFFPARPLAIVTIKNSSNRDLNVVLMPHENSSLTQSAFRRVLVKGKSELPVEIIFDYTDHVEPNQRFFLFHLDVAFIIGREKIDAAPVYQLIEKVGDEYILTNEESYMRKNLRPVLVDGRAYTGTAQIDRGAGVIETVNPPVNTFFMGRENDLGVDINNLPRVEQIRGLAPKELANMLPMGHLPTKFTGPGRPKPSVTTAVHFNYLTPNFTEALACAPGSAGCRSGFLMYTAFAGLFKWAGWGFTVELWSFEKLSSMDPNPQWKMIGSTEVEPNGLWSIQPQFGYSAESLKMYVYRMGNRFITMMNPMDLDKNYRPTQYTWSEFVKPKQVNGIWTEQYFFAKKIPLTQQGGLGLGVIFHSSMKLWSKLALGQVNPLNGFSYKIHYPNKLTNMAKGCVRSDASGTAYVWSCSGGAFGDIWIIPEHADLETVVHELGHSINKKFWGKGNWPSEGGSHSLSGCYSPGLALTEGWADFLPYWVKFGSTEKTPLLVSFNVDIEKHSLKCADQTKFNEMSVAATFWDLYDKVDETPELTRYDVISYDQDIGSVVEYLQTPQSSITTFRNKVMGKSPIDIQKLIYDMFSLNYTMIQN